MQILIFDIALFVIFVFFSFFAKEIVALYKIIVIDLGNKLAKSIIFIIYIIVANILK